MVSVQRFIKSMEYGIRVIGSSNSFSRSLNFLSHFTEKCGKMNLHKINWLCVYFWTAIFCGPFRLCCCYFYQFLDSFFSVIFYCFCRRQILYRCTRNVQHSIDTLKSRETGDCVGLQCFFAHFFLRIYVQFFTVFALPFNRILGLFSTSAANFNRFFWKFIRHLFCQFIVWSTVVRIHYVARKAIQHTKNSLQNFLYIHLRPYSSHSSEN